MSGLNSLPAPNGADAVTPSRGPGRISSCTDQRHRWCGRTLLDLLHPPTSLIGERGRGSSWFRHCLLQPWLSRTWLLQSFLAPPRSCTLSNAIAIRPWAFGVLQGFSPEDRRRASPSFDGSARPLSWGFAPSSGREHKGSGCYPGTSTSPAVASSGFEPSRRLDPLRAFPTFLPRPLLGLLPSGLFSSRRSGPTFEGPYPPGIA
jgi:hypothetical protein